MSIIVDALVGTRLAPMKDLLGNPIEPEKPKQKGAKKVVQVAKPPINESILARVRPYRITRLSTTQVWCINL